MIYINLFINIYFDVKPPSMTVVIPGIENFVCVFVLVAQN